MAQQPQLDLLKRQFLAALNHELRTPLSGIMGMTSLLEQSPLNDEQREYVALTKACAEELYAVLSAALEFTALAAGDIRLDHSEFPLEEAIESLAAEWLVKAKNKGLNFYLQLDDNVPEAARGDEIRLRKLIGHLLSNAVKFTEQGTVELRVRAENWRGERFGLRVEVHDTGVGMSEEQLNRVFESFTQLESGLGRRHAGMGLGLTLARGLAKVMGGELEVQSTVGKGSCFAFTIPLEAAAWRAATSSERKVLVVDDNDAARKVAAAFLKRGGYQVAVADSGAEALERASAEKFDLVLMDLQMPVMDGITATEKLRAISGYERTPIVALTANAGDDYRILCLSHGMQGYLPKPVDSDTLLRTVRQLL